MNIITKDTMKKAEAAAVKNGMTYTALMENAGAAASEYILKTVFSEGKTAVILCGCGNNGGDGFVIARKLFHSGFCVKTVMLGEPSTEDSKYMFSLLPHEVEVCHASEGEGAILKADIIVDALFGTGLSRELSAEASVLITAANNTDAVRFAIDIPSGAECDTGRIFGLCFKADYTVTFEAYKPCHILPPSNGYCGKTQVVSIGIEKSVMDNLPSVGEIIPPVSVKKREKNSHKGSFGTALTLCGNYGMSGASVMAATAALRSGVGILKAATVEENYLVMAKTVPEAVLIPCESRNGRYKKENIDRLKGHIEKADALLIGCGLGADEDTAFLTKEAALMARCSVIIDADGINAIADSIDFIKQMRAPLILTPHPGEMSRLCRMSVREIESDRIGIAKRFATEWGVWLVLKGANTVVATPEGHIYINVSGNPGMATGGSGDVLSGIMVALLAEGYPTTKAVCDAVRIHGDVGDLACKKTGEIALLPRDMLENLPDLFNNLTKEA